MTIEILYIGPPPSPPNSLICSDVIMLFIICYNEWAYLRGNTILVGALGQQLTSLSSLALFLAGYDMQSVDFSKETSFRDGMKSLFRQAGLGGRPIGVIIKASWQVYSV